MHHTGPNRQNKEREGVRERAEERGRKREGGREREEEREKGKERKSEEKKSKSKRGKEIEGANRFFCEKERERKVLFPPVRIIFFEINVYALHDYLIYKKVNNVNNMRKNEYTQLVLNN